MPVKVKVKDADTGKMVDGHVVKIVNFDEPFSHVILEDGTEVTLKTSVSRVVRFLNKRDKNGAPVYSVEVTGSMTVNVHADLYEESSDDE